MKIFNFALLGLINAQAPSPQKDCTDCLVSFGHFFTKSRAPQLTFVTAPGPSTNEKLLNRSRKAFPVRTSLIK